MSVHPFSRRGASTFTVIAALLLTMVLFAAGCGGSSASTSTAAPTSTAPASTDTTGGTGTTATTTGSGGQTVQVVMSQIAFDPKEVTIKVGDTVTWLNKDAPQHDVVAENGEFKSDLLDLDATFSFTFTQPGTFPYYCSVHPRMTGTVVVQ